MNIDKMIEHLQESGKVYFPKGDIKEAIEELSKRGYKVRFEPSTDYLILYSFIEVKKETKRVQLTLSNEMDLHLQRMGDEMGIGKCGLIRVAIKFYLDYHEGLKNASKLPEMLRVLKDLNECKK